MKLVIGNKNYSSWSLRPWLLLKAFDVPFEEQNVSLLGLGTPGLTRRLLDYSPSARVPVLIDGERVIWDTLAICEYVSEQYLSGRGWPENPGCRARARAITAEMHSGFAALRTAMPMNCRAKRRLVPTGAVLADIKRVDEIWSDRRPIEDGDSWLFGEFSIADCFYAPVAFRFETYGVVLSSEASEYMKKLLAHPAVEDWYHDALLESEVIVEDEAGEDV
jgi:glutathione S-transferase